MGCIINFPRAENYSPMVMVQGLNERKTRTTDIAAAPTSSPIPSAGRVWATLASDDKMSGKCNSYSFWGYFLILLLKEKLLLEIIKMGEFMDSISIVC